ncbi:hypothetical protein FDECE_8496 [Fusarium decemcellulare]|nr:hypothetical protein FDECE_8496 [Fusarium decemcellulare]
MVKSTDNLTGEEISKIAYAQPSIKPSGLGVAIEVLIYFFTVICTIVIALRVYVKTWRVEANQRWRVNDYLAVFGFLPFIPASVLGALAVHYGIGATDSHLNRYEMKEFLIVRGMEYLLLYELTYYAASSLTKFAIAVTILHICVQKRYVYLMYGLMGVMILTNGICLIWLFVNCVPFATYWNPKLGHCKAEDGFLNLSYVGTAVQVAADWTCAITPFFIVYSLQMPKRTKFSVVAILGLGVLASIAALMRIVSYKYIDIKVYPKDHMVAEGRLLLWSLLESSLAIIACSLPSLKLFGGCVARSMNRSKNLTPGSRNPYHHDAPLASLTPHGQTRTTVSGKGNWDRLHDDDSSGRHIIQETEIHIDTHSNTSTANFHRSSNV